MVIRSTRFNIYLLCLALLSPAAGCRSPESRREKQLATFRVHVEVNPDGAGLSEAIPIYRAHPTLVNVDRGPILTEGNVAEARVSLDTLNGFALQIQLDPRGTLLLEQYTAMNSGKRFAIYADFGEKLAEHRWLGAPIIARRISNGVLTFTPDATRDEAEEIARGLNNVAIKNGNQAKPKKSKATTQ
jgi:preprotein translocase subunit SecD